jgi:hypothetical protein
LSNVRISRSGYVPVNIARQTEPFATVQAVKDIPPKGDVAKLMSCATGFERDFLLCLLHTAGRIPEVREMAWEVSIWKTGPSGCGQANAGAETGNHARLP